MPTSEEIEQYRERLKAHRGTLAHYLQQRAKFGNAFLPPHVAHGIVETRESIKSIKQTLRAWAVDVEDLPDDEESIVEQPKMLRTQLSKTPKFLVPVASITLLLIIFLVVYMFTNRHPAPPPNGTPQQQTKVASAPSSVNPSSNEITPSTSSATSVPQGSPCPPTIKFGETIECEVKPGAETRIGFTAAVSDRVLIRVITMTGLLNPILRIRMPGSQEVVCNLTTPSYETKCGGKPLLANGMYTIEITDRNNPNTGIYRFYLQRLNNPGNARLISLGQILTGTIDPALAMNTYSFSVNTGGMIPQIRMERKENDGLLEPQFNVYGPDGQWVFGGGVSQGKFAQASPTQSLPLGTYTILTEDATRTNGGTYTLQVRQR